MTTIVKLVSKGIEVIGDHKNRHLHITVKIQEGVLPPLIFEKFFLTYVTRHDSLDWKDYDADTINHEGRQCRK